MPITSRQIRFIRGFAIVPVTFRTYRDGVAVDVTRWNVKRRARDVTCLAGFSTLREAINWAKEHSSAKPERSLYLCPACWSAIWAPPDVTSIICGHCGLSANGKAAVAWRRGS